MREYIATNDPHAQGPVDRANKLFNKWDYFLRKSYKDPSTRGKTLTLYIDQETHYEFMRLLDFSKGVGPFNIHAGKYEQEYSLFGRPVELVEVVYRGERHNHLCYI